jgi:hypothetical protein
MFLQIASSYEKNTVTLFTLRADNFNQMALSSVSSSVSVPDWDDFSKMTNWFDDISGAGVPRISAVEESCVRLSKKLENHPIQQGKIGV